MGLADAVREIGAAAGALAGDRRGRVRIEDLLAVVAAATGEAALAAAGWDVDGHELRPGAALFFDGVNDLLTGEAPWAADAPATTVVGVLVREGPVAPGRFPALGDLYRHVAASVGEAPWGEVVARVPPEHQPTVVPLRAAFELRPAVLRAEAAAGLEVADRAVLLALVLAGILDVGQYAVPVDVALALALDVTFGMAKMVPMSQAAYDAAFEAAEQEARRDPQA